MARDAQNQAKQTYNTASGLEGSSAGEAGNLYSTLVPQFEQEASGTEGFSPTDIANMNTASQQSLGGGVASAVGTGAERAAANRNSGSMAPSLDEASRNATKQLSTNALDVQNANAQLKQKNKQAGIQGEENLFNTENQDVLSSLGLQNQSTNALTNAGNSGWFQNFTGLLGAVRGAGANGQGGFSV